MDRAFLDDRIASLKTRIVAWEEASLALAGGAASYTIDTGQTRSTVTRSNLTEIENTIARLTARLRELETERDGTGSSIVSPAW